jgi:hypothetical protein
MIIGISGKIGSGKDTVGMIIQALSIKKTIGYDTRYSLDPLEYVKNYEGRPNLKGGWEIKKFAFKLKQIVSLLTSIPVEDLEKQEVKDSLLGDEWYTFIGLEEVLKTGNGRRPYTVREMLQKVGTEAMRNTIHTNVWVNALFADYKPFIENYPQLIKSNVKELIEGDSYSMGKAVLPNWIITDVRFPNEANIIKEKGGILLRVNRVSNNPISNHPSETSLDNYDKFDYTIENNGTLEELLEEVKSILQKEKL